ncbi:VIT1/CCC1 transporter family protein [Stappia sp. MMSF_3263]|uniref:VIT1/CCC1 transporter family protein n=1 Tax=Stappia sp. MMSF_3263 TaxID=3046693 RepID=UPI00273ECD02|nr:VIT1/CCC1 transporter family protein [Stappia sp. MMSF_3263]
MPLEHDHTAAAIAARLARGPRISYLRDWIYGGIDGAVTTFAIVAGSIGASLSARVILILGIANLIADGFSMAAANYSGTKAEHDDYERLRKMEERHIDREPGGETEEIRQIFKAKGYRGEELEQMTTLITSRRSVWVETMLSEEHGVSNGLRDPLKSALATFSAFVVCGAVPLVPFVAGLPASAATAAIATGIVFFAIGSAKSKWSTQGWLRSGLETLSIGLGAAGLAWAAGHLLERFIA